MTLLSPFRLMLVLFSGFVISIVFGSIGYILVWYFESESLAINFIENFVRQFKTILVLGLVIGTSLIVKYTHDIVPETIESAFTKPQLSKTNYYKNKGHFRSLFRTVTFGAQLGIVGFAVFSYCQFPMQGVGEILMMIAVCAQYVLGAYVGRKLVYIGMMLHSLINIKVTRNLFQKHELDDINTYVNVASTLTIIAVYVHVISYYAGPFQFNSFLGENIKIFLIFPAVIATPVLLIFNFYPRFVLRRLYSQSIDIEITKLQKILKDEALTAYEKRSYLIEFDKMSREELRYNLQLTLSDLPFGITILFMVLEPMLKR